MGSKSSLGILDALENLNTLLDVDTINEIEITEESRFIPHKEKEGEEIREIYWVQAGSDDQTVRVVKETFRSVFDYLQFFYRKMKDTGDTKKLAEGMNTIMVLVGEAAKKLDRLGVVFKERVSEFSEYKDLQNFYRREVVPESFQTFAKSSTLKKKVEVIPHEETLEHQLKQILGREEEVEEVAGIHILNDLKVIQRDHLYELFYLKNEQGTHFYTYDLARNIKLACDFGEFAEEYFSDDPLLQIKNWEDKELHLLALAIRKSAGHFMDKFYQEAMKYKEMGLIALLHNACMALMLASDPKNLIRQFSLKGCHLYFWDFLFFLRAVLHNREFEKLVIYGSSSEKSFFQNALNLIYQFCRLLYTQTHDRKELSSVISQIVEKTIPNKNHVNALSDRLMQTNLGLIQAFKKHPSGPVFKAVDIIRETREFCFDPLIQGNLPFHEWTLSKEEQVIHVLHLPCPIIQQWIHHAIVSEEFKTFLRGFEINEKLLIVNFQDRTSWKEHARSMAIEELAQKGEFAPYLTTITLAKDTHFYNQSDLYQELDKAESFIGHLRDHLRDPTTGYYFPDNINKQLFPDFIDSLLIKIHKIFFDFKKTLSYLERLDFIQLVYHFIELKLIEIIQPSYIALISKDSLDIGGTSNVGLLALLAIGCRKNLDYKKIEMALFGSTIMQRERVIHPERFDRLYNFIRLLESKGDYLSHFIALFKKDSFNWEIS
ncbi:MAG: hypothetical protein R3E91_01520 [Chlamydiales bacterium]